MLKLHHIYRKKPIIKIIHFLYENNFIHKEKTQISHFICLMPCLFCNFVKENWKKIIKIYNN